jgi:hypothetical protein
VSEQWRAIPGYEGIYEVSDQGRIRSQDRRLKGRILKQRVALGRKNRSTVPTRAWQITLCHNRIKKTHLVHRLVMMAFLGLQPDELVDHINGDSLDNRLSNLRKCTLAQNGYNSKKPKNNKSGYKGVCFQQNKWRASIHVNGKQKFLGYYDTPEEAHAAYCAAAREYYGEFARFE